MNKKPDKKHKLTLVGLAIGSFIVGTRILYLFKESQKDNLILNISVVSVGLIIAVVSLLYMYKSNN